MTAKKDPKDYKKMGRPTKYKPEYCQAIIDFFSIPRTDKKGSACDPPFLIDFCLSIGINQDTMHEWVSVHPNFSEAYKIAKLKQEQFLAINAIQDRYNASFAWRTMMNVCGWRDKQDVDQKIKLPPGLKISFETE